MANSLRKTRGRPPGALNKKTILIKIAYERHQAPKGYGSKTCNTMEILFLLLRQSAMEGNLDSIEKFEVLAQTMLPRGEHHLILDFSTGKGNKSAHPQSD